MPSDEITKLILSRLEPLPEGWPQILKNVGGLGPYAQLVGAGIALLECKALLERGSAEKWQGFSSALINEDLRLIVRSISG